MRQSVKRRVILSEYCPKIAEEIVSLGYDVIRLPKAKKFDDFLSYHVDLFLTKIDGSLFASKNIADNLEIENTAVKTVVQGYPDETALNCFSLQNRLFCNPKTVALEILDFAKKREMEIIPLKQSYSKCSCCIVGENAVITEDEGTAKILRENGVSTLVVKSGFVNLPGYGYGFIGGASFYDGTEKTVYFFGNVKAHPQYGEIFDFCRQNGTKIVVLNGDEPLIDIGSAVVLS